MNKLVFSLGLLVLFAVSNCGDDDDEVIIDDAGGIVIVDAGNGDAASDNDAAFVPVTCDDDGEGACQNATDCPAVEDGSARETASSCGVGCLGDDDEASCSQACLVDETGITDSCAECYVEIVTCSRDNCLTDCLGDPDSDACFDCQVDAGCRATFDDCSGLPPPR